MNKSENVFVTLRYCKVRKYQRTETLTYEDKTATTFDEKEKARTAIYVSNVHKHFTVNIRNDIIHDGNVQIIDIYISNKVFRVYNVYNKKRNNIYTV